MGIASAFPNTLLDAVAAGDDCFHLLGTADTVLIPSDYILEGSSYGVMVGSQSEVNSFFLFWPTSALADAVVVSAQSPYPAMMPIHGSSPNKIVVRPNFVIDSASLLLPPPVVDLFFFLRPGLALSTLRAPKALSLSGTTNEFGSVIGQFYVYGRKTLFATVKNTGAIAMTVDALGVTQINSGAVFNTVLGTGVAAPGGTITFVFPNDQAFAVFRLIATTTAPGVSSFQGHMEARD